MALFLSFVFIVTWNVFFPPTPPNNDELENTIQSDTNKPHNMQKEFVANEVASAFGNNNIDTVRAWIDDLERNGSLSIEFAATNIETPLMSIDLINAGTSIKNLKILESNDNILKHVGAWDALGAHYDTQAPVELARDAFCNPCLLIDGQAVRFELISKVEFEGKSVDENYHVIESKDIHSGTIVKKTIIYNNSYNIDHIFSGLPQNNVALVWDGGLLPSEQLINDDMLYFSVYAQNQDSYQEEYLSSVSGSERFEFNDNVGWAGLKSKYFMTAITNDNYRSFKADRVVFKAKEGVKIEGAQTINSDMTLYYKNLYDGTLKINSYIGPIDTHYLETEQNQHLVQLFGFGWFIIGYLGKLIMWLLTGLYAFIPNYGVVCILFAFIIRVFTGPLTKKSFLSNQKMQAVQPKLKKIQEKYKDDSVKLNQEIMNLYKTEGVNPLGGCLPILIQMPLLIALFQVFRKTIEFRGAPFLPFWITDLSQPDVILQFDFLKQIWGISYFFGHGIALLPIIMGVVMFLNMKMTTSSNINPSQASTMYIMNGFFILLFNTFPSGLNLYYTIYNILNFFQQRKLQKSGT